jgi:hypothetical protein
VQYDHDEGFRKSTRSYAAFVTTKEGARTQVVGLGRADTIDALLSEWRKEAVQGGREEAYRACGSAAPQGDLGPDRSTPR